MSASPTAAKYWAALTTMRDLLKTEAPPAKADGWLARAAEVRIGLYANLQAFKPSGCYVLPAADTPTEEETNLFVDPFEVSVLCQVRALKADQSDDDPTTRALTELVGGVKDLIQRNRTVAGDGTWTFESVAQPVEFYILPHTDGGYLFRAEVRVIARIEVPT